MTLQQLVDKMTIDPAKTFDLPYGELAEGAIADVTLIDLDKTMEINKNDFHSKGKNTPFHGWKVDGIPVLTIFEGGIVYEEA